MHLWSVWCAGLKVNSDTLADEGEQGEYVQTLAIGGQLSAQTLHEPTATCGVPPRIEARYGGVGNQEIGMDGYLVAHRGVAIRFGATRYHGDARIQTITLAGLYKEQLGLARQCGAMIGCEVTPDIFQFILRILRIYMAHFSVREYGHQNAIVVLMILCRSIFNCAQNLLIATILIHTNIKIQLLEHPRQVLTVDICACARLQGWHSEVLVIEDDGHATILVPHIVFGCMSIGHHFGYIFVIARRTVAIQCQLTDGAAAKATLVVICRGRCTVA